MITSLIQKKRPNNLGPLLRTGTDALIQFGMGNKKLEDIVQAQLLLIATFWSLSYIGLRLTKQKYQVMMPPPPPLSSS